MTRDLNRLELRAEFLAGDAQQPQASPIASCQLGDIDFTPIVQSTIWDKVCRQPHLPIVLDQYHAALEAVWHPDHGRPIMGGVKVMLSEDGPVVHVAQLPLNLLDGAVTSAAAQLVADGKLGADSVCHYRICADPRADQEAPRDAAVAGLRVEIVNKPLAVRGGLISDLLQRSRQADQHPEQSMPVFVPRHVVAEMHNLTRAAGARETGGILIGHVRFDRTIPEIFLEVTAQIEAVHTQQAADSLTLTPQTWAAATAAVELRRAGEVMVGWWHCHPDFCAKCPAEKRRNCQLPGDFFSAQDRTVHRCCFSRGFQIAMVVSHQGHDNLSTAMYGWRHGTVQRRTYHVVGD